MLDCVESPLCMNVCVIVYVTGPGEQQYCCRSFLISLWDQALDLEELLADSFACRPHAYLLNIDWFPKPALRNVIFLRLLQTFLIGYRSPVMIYPFWITSEIYHLDIHLQNMKTLGMTLYITLFCINQDLHNTVVYRPRHFVCSLYKKWMSLLYVNYFMSDSAFKQ